MFDISEEIRNNSDSEAAEKLANCISCGVAFHNAGLSNENRKAVESGFKNGLIKVIFATPTLAAGLNLPARRVIISGYQRYNKSLAKSEDIPILEYKQMAGRAGRPHLDPYGECVIIPILTRGQHQEANRVVERYIKGKSEPIESYLGILKSLRIHILSSVATGFVSTIEDIYKLLGETFLAYSTSSGEPAYLEKNITEAINYLINENMVKVESGNLSVTQLGALVSHLCIDPTTASLILKGFSEIEKGIKFTDMTLIHLLCMTDDMPTRNVSKTEENNILSIFKNYEQELIKFNFMYIDQITDRLKIADIIMQWINEVKLSEIADSWKNMGEGDVHSIVESANWITYAMYSIGKYHKNNIITHKTRIINARIKYGIRDELLGLIQIDGIARVRARRLFNAGITTQKKYTEELEKNKQRIHDILYPKGEKKPKNSERSSDKKPIKQTKMKAEQRSIIDFQDTCPSTE